MTTRVLVLVGSLRAGSYNRQLAEVVHLADVEDFADREIADIMGTPIGTVASRLHRGRRQRRALLEDYARQRHLVRPEQGAGQREASRVR